MTGSKKIYLPLSNKKGLLIRSTLHKKLGANNSISDALKQVYDDELRVVTLKALALTDGVKNLKYLRKVFASRVASSCSKLSNISVETEAPN